MFFIYIRVCVKSRIFNENFPSIKQFTQMFVQKQKKNRKEYYDQLFSSEFNNRVARSINI